MVEPSFFYVRNFKEEALNLECNKACRYIDANGQNRGVKTIGQNNVQNIENTHGAGSNRNVRSLR